MGVRRSGFGVRGSGFGARGSELGVLAAYGRLERGVEGERKPPKASSLYFRCDAIRPTGKDAYATLLTPPSSVALAFTT